RLTRLTILPYTTLFRSSDRHDTSPGHRGLSTYEFYFIKKEGSKVPRRGNVPKREVLPDPLYNSVLVTKLVNSIMLDGKKGVAQRSEEHTSELQSRFDLV